MLAWTGRYDSAYGVFTGSACIGGGWTVLGPILDHLEPAK